MITAGPWTFNEENEALAFYEEKLFEVKQHLQSKPLLRATIKSRMTLLHQLVELEKQLDIDSQTSEFSLPNYQNKRAIEQWSLFSATSSAWKLTVFQSESAEELLVIIEKGFSFLKDFYAILPKNLPLLEEDPKIGIAENIMHIQAGITWMKATEINEFSELENRAIDENETVKLFYLELKRLSLRLPYL